MLKQAVTALALLTSPAVAAEPLDGTKSIYLVEHNGSEHLAGHVSFKKDGEQSTYDVEWLSEKFTDHFLSMRPFKCLEGTDKYWCRVAYPYPIKRTVSTDNLIDLEYDTMFIWKGAKEYGINMWNGVYYRITIENDQLIGKIHEIDMNTLSAPPEEGNLRPVQKDDLEPGEPESHWLPKIIIR